MYRPGHTFEKFILNIYLEAPFRAHSINIPADNEPLVLTKKCNLENSDSIPVYLAKLLSYFTRFRFIFTLMMVLSTIETSVDFIFV